MLTQKVYLLAVFVATFTLSSLPLLAKAPRLTVIIVIDQLSAHYLPKLRPYLKGGIGLMAQNGVHFVNAFYDHAMPATGPGHYLLSTGTYGSVHGIINNKWFDKEGNVVACDDDTVKNAAVFNPHGGLYPYGKSARLSLVDNLSDQLIMHSYPHAHNTVWALSIKSRTAIAMAGRLGKALWLDEKTGNYTSSKAYFKKLPSWLKKFNKRLSSKPSILVWDLFFPPTHPGYVFDNVKNYTYSTLPFSYLGKSISYRSKKRAQIYDAMPHANKDLLDLALTTFEKNYSGKPSERFILWLGLSSLDKVGHIYGPQSIQALDMIYHIDAQLEAFMEKLYQRVPREEVLFILTADHGITPLPELAHKQGLDLARRYIDTDLRRNLNTLIKASYGIENFVIRFKEPQFYVNQKILARLSDDTQKKIYQSMKDQLLSVPGIRRAWTFDELQNAHFATYDLDKYLARQLYKGRSGQIIFSVNPYTMIDSHALGTTHSTQYAYDTQVPLIFYQKGRFTQKQISTTVYIPQICVTLATLFDVPRPSAATASVLPGLEI